MTVAAVILGLLVVISLPFLFVSSSDVRGVPGPLVIVVCLVGSFLLGPRLGGAIGIFGVGLAVIVIGENAVAEPVVWIPVIVGVGVVGDRVRRTEDLRRDLLVELREGLVALSEDQVVGPLEVKSRYMPVEQAQMLAGDFYGVVLGPTGTVEVMVGDVAGHGASAAAVATHLRAAWRGLATAGVAPGRIMSVLNDSLIAERRRVATQVVFATVCVASVDPDRMGARVVLAGHPPPLLVRRHGTAPLELEPDPPIGVDPTRRWAVHDVALPDEVWTLLLYSDGLVEGRVAPGGERPFGLPRLAQLLDGHAPLTEERIDHVLARVREANGGPMSDDIVVVAVSPSGGPSAVPGPSVS
ncbi:MAG: PP2C family protein-serine/threonine phosphatase [Gaiellales bacterium]